MFNKCGYFCGYVISVVHKSTKKADFLGKTYVDKVKSCKEEFYYNKVKRQDKEFMSTKILFNNTVEL